MFGIEVSPNKQKYSFPNPIQGQENIFVLADVSHLIKNLRNHFLKGQVIVLPDDMVKKFSLPSNEVSIKPLEALVNFQEVKQLKLAPRVSKASIDLGNFSKMRVSLASDLLSKSTASAIRILVDQFGFDKTYLTTAWFLEQTGHWFQLMLSRRPSIALGKKCKSKRNESTQFLEHFKDLISRMKIGGSVGWKPVQRGIVISTLSILGLQKRLLDEKGFSFVLTARFSTDAVENLFSTVRATNPVPSPIEFKRILKIITLTQFLKVNSSASYAADNDSDFLADLSDFHKMLKKESCEDEEFFNLASESEKIPDLNLDISEKNSLSYLSGYVISKFKRKKRLCQEFFIDSAEESNENQLTILKEYSKGALVQCSKEAFEVFEHCEKMFQHYIKQMLEKKNIQQLISTYILKELNSFHLKLPKCMHFGTVIENFIHVRVILWTPHQSKVLIAQQKSTITGQKNSSRSMAMREKVK